MIKFKYFKGFLSEVLTNDTPHDLPLHIPIPLPIPLRIPIPFEPMRQNRFIVRFPERLGISEYMVKSMSRPSCTFNNGIMQWDDLILTFYDLVHPSVAQPLFQLMNDLELNRNLEIKVEMLGPVGDVVSVWSVYGFLREVNFGTLDYGNSDFTEISMTLCVDHAILEY